MSNYFGGQGMTEMDDELIGPSGFLGKSDVWPNDEEDTGSGGFLDAGEEPQVVEEEDVQKLRLKERFEAKLECMLSRLDDLDERMREIRENKAHLREMVEDMIQVVYENL